MGIFRTIVGRFGTKIRTGSVPAEEESVFAPFRRAQVEHAVRKEMMAGYKEYLSITRGKTLAHVNVAVLKNRIKEELMHLTPHYFTEIGSVRIESFSITEYPVHDKHSVIIEVGANYRGKEYIVREEFAL